MLLHHVQVPMPHGAEDLARRFYADALGLQEVEKPDSLAGRGGCWFRSLAADGRTVEAEIHVGVDDPFVPAKKAHPALLVGSVVELEQRADSITAAGFEVSWVERVSLEGFERFHCRDGFGNRVEILALTV
ncbi:VOC family protein [Arthrobacter rhombi]|uniref:VOC family protein n=1 Tax=Arthrobacter rhombi TaxID=71253 RepID=UPI003FD4A9D9